jgi:hypothetical protein
MIQVVGRVQETECRSRLQDREDVTLFTEIMKLNGCTSWICTESIASSKGDNGLEIPKCAFHCKFLVQDTSKV